MNEVELYEDWLKKKRAEDELMGVGLKRYTYITLDEGVGVAIGDGTRLLVGVKWEE